ncbi:MAG: type II secretion system protein [Sulfuricurvum sp.]
MRKALTLIELILSMVIIGITFTVIPKLIQAMNQGAQTTIKEEAMYNALALMGAMVNLPWDENNTLHGQILSVTNGAAAYDCNTTTGYRVGGFVGGRECRPESNGTVFSASSSLGIEGTIYNDLDDYTATINVDNNCSRAAGKSLYALNPTISYVNDPGTGNAIALSDIPTGQSSNTKHIVVQAGYHADNKFSGCIAAFRYDAFNIGQTHINSRSW